MVVASAASRSGHCGTTVVQPPATGPVRHRAPILPPPDLREPLALLRSADKKTVQRSVAPCLGRPPAQRPGLGAPRDGDLGPATAVAGFLSQTWGTPEADSLPPPSFAARSLEVYGMARPSRSPAQTPQRPLLYNLGAGRTRAHGPIGSYPCRPLQHHRDDMRGILDKMLRRIDACSASIQVQGESGGIGAECRHPLAPEETRAVGAVRRVSPLFLRAVSRCHLSPAGRL
jgi:hypothetical protein